LGATVDKDEGTVADAASVSNDAIEDERRGLLYNIRIRLLKDTVVVMGQSIQLALWGRFQLKQKLIAEE
jgi:hemolysin D